MISTGVRPFLIYNHPKVIGLRDFISVESFISYLEKAKKVVLVGNGGIALELAHEVEFLINFTQEITLTLILASILRY